MAGPVGHKSLARSTSTLKVGDQAPDFGRRSHTKEKVRLADFRGKKNVVLAFTPLAWTSV